MDYIPPAHLHVAADIAFREQRVGRAQAVLAQSRNKPLFNSAVLRRAYNKPVHTPAPEHKLTRDLDATTALDTSMRYDAPPALRFGSEAPSTLESSRWAEEPDDSASASTGFHNAAPLGALLDHVRVPEFSPADLSYFVAEPLRGLGASHNPADSNALSGSDGHYSDNDEGNDGRRAGDARMPGDGAAFMFIADAGRHLLSDVTRCLNATATNNTTMNTHRDGARDLNTGAHNSEQLNTAGFLSGVSPAYLSRARAAPEDTAHETTSFTSPVPHIGAMAATPARGTMVAMTEATPLRAAAATGQALDQRLASLLTRLDFKQSQTHADVAVAPHDSARTLAKPSHSYARMLQQQQAQLTEQQYQLLSQKEQL